MSINYFVGIDTGHFSVCYRTPSPHGNGAVHVLARLQKEFWTKKKRRAEEESATKAEKESREVKQHSFRGASNTSCPKNKWVKKWMIALTGKVTFGLVYVYVK